MAKAVISPLHFLMILLFHLSTNQLALAQEDGNQFIYNGFLDSNLSLNGIAEIQPNGLLQLTDTSNQASGHAFYQFPITFNTSSFSTNFVFAMVPELANLSGHGIAFLISPTMDFSRAVASQYLGLFNSSNNGNSSNRIFAVEFDSIISPEFEDIDDNHVGIDLNSLTSNLSTSVQYYSNLQGVNKSLELISGDPIQVWIDYDELVQVINVTLAPITEPKPNQPLLSTNINLSLILLDSMYVGFSSATGSMASSHYILGWSFNKSGQAQNVDPSQLPPLPRERKSRKKPRIQVTISVVILSIVIIVMAGTGYVLRRRKYGELREDWEQEYGPQRFSYKDLYRATKGFKDKELLGFGGFGKVYRGVIPRTDVQVAVKKVSHGSSQGIKEFVAEIVSMGRLRHRNLVQLLGYCRRKGELLLVYDYMPNGSLDKFLHSNEKPNLDWSQRYQILRGIASGLLYLHEEWEQLVLHRDVKASNVLLDAEFNGRLGDFGLAKLYDHGANPQTTHVVGTVGYIAPELTRIGKATTKTDVYAFGAFMLEMACGRRPIEVQGLPEEIILADWVLKSWKQGAILQTSDSRLEGQYPVEEMELVLKLGLLCSHSNPAARPGMRQVVQYLDGHSVLPETNLETADSLVLGTAETSNEFALSFPSSFANVSVCSVSSSESILSSGR